MTRRLWVLGDSWTDPAYGGWAWADGFPRLLAASLGCGLTNSGLGGNGYVRVGGGNGSSIAMQAARGAGAGADTVLVWGSVNDRHADAPPLDVFTAATITYSYLTRACPGADLFVCGPQHNSADPPPPLSYEHRDAVRAAAATAGARFIDPLGWFLGRPSLLDSTGHPLPAGHELITQHLLPDLVWALAARPSGPDSTPEGPGLTVPWEAQPEPANPRN